jgi:hypothetical protein
MRSEDVRSSDYVNKIFDWVAMYWVALLLPYLNIG